MEDKKSKLTPSQLAKVSNDPAFLKGMKPSSKGKVSKKDEDSKVQDSSKDDSVP